MTDTDHSPRFLRPGTVALMAAATIAVCAGTVTMAGATGEHAPTTADAIPEPHAPSTTTTIAIDDFDASFPQDHLDPCPACGMG